MTTKEAEDLRAAWEAKGNPPCNHPHREQERSAYGQGTGDFVCTTCGHYK